MRDNEKHRPDRQHAVTELVSRAMSHRKFDIDNSGCFWSHSVGRDGSTIATREASGAELKP